MILKDKVVIVTGSSRGLGVAVDLGMTSQLISKEPYQAKAIE